MSFLETAGLVSMALMAISVLAAAGMAWRYRQYIRMYLAARKLQGASAVGSWSGDAAAQDGTVPVVKPDARKEQRLHARIEPTVKRFLAGGLNTEQLRTELTNAASSENDGQPLTTKDRNDIEKAVRTLTAQRGALGGRSRAARRQAAR